MEKHLTIQSSLQRAKKEIPLRDAEIFLGEILQKPTAFLLAHHEHQMTTEQAEKFWDCVQKRKLHFGVWDILGEKEFLGLSFLTNELVLTPRGETEILVERVLDFLSQQDEKIKIFDIGTGSGCIAVSIAKKSPENVVVGVDISEKALEIAQKNAQKNIVSIEFVQSDLWKNIAFQSPQKTVVVANLPYIPTKDEIDETARKSDPHLALFSGEDGMDLYRKFFDEIPENPLAIFFEFHPPQKPIFEEIFQKKFSNAAWNFFADFDEKIRFGEIFFYKK